MTSQETLQKLLYEKFEETRLKNPAYSLRGFAKRLGINASTLSRILNGERGVSQTLAEKICAKLLLDPQRRAEVMGAFPTRRRYRKTIDSVGSEYFQLTVDQFKIIGDWYHFAILSLMKTENFSAEPSFIAKRLGILETEASQAIERLARLEMIERDSEGQWKRARPKFRTSDDIPNISLQKAQRQNLDLALQALVDVPVELRDFTAITMPADPDLLPKAKELIRKFQDDLSDLLESGKGTEVYKFCAQLFPLTRVEKKEKQS